MLQLSSWKMIIGITLVLFAWIDPFDFGDDFQIITFILGFDALPLIPKILVFGIDYLKEISGWGLFLLILIAEEIVLEFMVAGKLIQMIVKPAIIFLLIILNDIPLLIALLVAGIDLLLNFHKKLI